MCKSVVFCRTIHVTFSECNLEAGIIAGKDLHVNGFSACFFRTIGCFEDKATSG